jgi:uncharacterized delta-60 repeat protein
MCAWILRRAWTAPALAAALVFCLAPAANASASVRLDPSFAGGGFLFTAASPPSPSPRGSRVAEDASGRLVAVSAVADRFMIARYLPGGHLDSGFGVGGVAYVSLATGTAGREDEAIASALAIQPDGRILVGGSYDPDIFVEGGSGRPQLVLARLLADGRLDRSFGGNAGLEIPPGLVIESRGANVLAIALQGGAILIGGEAAAGPAYVARYRGDGRLDRSFGRGTGMAHFVRERARGAISGLLATAGGGVYAAGHLGGNFLLARLTANGVPDREFGKAGRTLTDAAHRPGCGGCSLGAGLARDRRGRLLVSGTLFARRPRGRLDPEGLTGARAIAVARYRDDGVLDRGFGKGGIARAEVGARAAGGGIALRPDGGIVVAGASMASASGQSRFTVARFLPGGRLDRRFFGDGVFTRSFGALISRASDPILDHSGRLIVAGSSAFGDSPAAGAQGVLLTRFLLGSSAK